MAGERESPLVNVEELEAVSDGEHDRERDRVFKPKPSQQQRQ